MSSDALTATLTSNSQGCYDMDTANQPFTGGLATAFSITIPTTAVVGSRHVDIFPQNALFCFMLGNST